MSILGIGRYARSKIFGRLVYEHVHRSSEHDPSAHHFRGYAVSRGYELGRFAIAQIASRGELDKVAFAGHFGASPEQTFPYVIEALVEAGLAQAEGDVVRFATQDPQELFVISRLFLDRPTVVEELAAADADVVQVELGSQRLRFCVEHLQDDGGPYAARSHRLGLRLEVDVGADAEPPQPEARLVVAVMLELFEQGVSQGSWLSALEVAAWLASKARPVLARDFDAAVTLGSGGVV